jgi:hypothetical protein
MNYRPFTYVCYQPIADIKLCQLCRNSGHHYVSFIAISADRSDAGLGKTPFQAFGPKSKIISEATEGVHSG